MKKSTILIIGISLIMSSCVYSLFPIYTNDTIIFDTSLMGRWKSDDHVIIFQPANSVDNISVSKDSHDYIVHEGDTVRDSRKIEEILTMQLQDLLDENQQGYKMTIMTEKESYSYLVHIIEINNDYFLDLYPWSADYKAENMPTPIATNMLPVHTFYKLEIDKNKDKINLVQFNLTMLRDMFKKNMIRLRHELVDDEVLITAQPKEIQKFIEKYASDPEVFDKGEMYTRI